MTCDCGSNRLKPISGQLQAIDPKTRKPFNDRVGWFAKCVKCGSVLFCTEEHDEPIGYRELDLAWEGDTP